MIKLIEDFYKEAVVIVDEDERRLVRELKNIFEEVKELGLLVVKNGKIKITNDILIKMSKKQNFYKQSVKTNLLLKKLKQKRVIDSKSLIYPKNIKFFSNNPLVDVLLDNSLNEVERILDIRDNLYKNIKLFENDIELYIYMRLFSLNKIKAEHILQITRNSFFNLNDNLSLLVVVGEKNEQNIQNIKIILIDKNLRDIFTDCYNKEVENLLDFVNNIFQNNLDFYELQKDKFLKQHNITLRNCKKAIDFEYLISNSPLELTLQNYKLHPKITLQELNYLFPDIIPKQLLDIEINNFKIFFNEFKEIIDEEKLTEDDKDIDDYLVKPFEILDDLKKIKIKEKKNLNNFFDEKYRYIDKYLNKDEFISQILIYIKDELFKKADVRYYDKPIKIATLKEYMNALFKYCFTILLKYDEINDFSILEIDKNIEEADLTANSKKKYKEIINRFLTKYSKYKFLNKVDDSVKIRRSIVFKDEFNKFIDVVLEQDKQLFVQEKYKMIKQIMRSVFAILLYNSGLRKNELRSRFQQDVVKINENEYFIYVDNRAFKKVEKQGDILQFSLKSKNAKRKVRFKIENKEHSKMVSKYYDWITKNNYQFFFPFITEKRLLKKQIAKKSFFNELSPILQQTTGRYTPIHSLRHSFATFYLLNRLKTKQYDKNMMFELIYSMGHIDPETTIKNYLHLDVIKILLNL